MNHFIGYPIITVLLFIGIVCGMLYYDIQANKTANGTTIARAARWSGYYVLSALGFAIFLLAFHGVSAASAFITGYVLEKVLSIDNLIVFSAVFAYFKVAEKDQYAILKWGIIGAVVFRLIFTIIGAGSLWLFGGWVELLFAFLVGWSGYKMLTAKADDTKTDYGKSAVMQFLQKHFPTIGTFMACMITIECTDILFAFDSVPTVIAVTRDPLLIYTSMIFAIMGLRSLYFLLAAVQKQMVYVEKAVIYILFFIAAKLAIHALFHLEINPLLSFLVIISMLTGGFLLSYVKKSDANPEQSKTTTTP